VAAGHQTRCADPQEAHVALPRVGRVQQLASQELHSDPETDARQLSNLDGSESLP